MKTTIDTYIKNVKKLVNDEVDGINESEERLVENMARALFYQDMPERTCAGVIVQVYQQQVDG